jgi:1-acyl-sn-glycerol-3-phosphate acyltransferase
VAPQLSASRGIARLALSIFFRRIEVVGAERVPSRGPLVVVANHGNGLIDPVLLLAALPRPVRFLGKSTLWRNPALRPFLALAGVIPVFRRHDPGVDPSRNVETFARCREALARGDAVALFPEGLSHGEPALQPLKTGAARITLGAAAEGVGAVAILPVGLSFDARESFRSRALVTVGEPFDAVAGAGLSAPPEPPGEEPAAVRALTAAIDEGLRAVTVEYRSWTEARLFERAVELFDRPELALPSTLTLAEVHRLARELRERFEELQAIDPEATARVAAATARYDRALGWLALRDDQVAARYPWAGVLRFTARTLAVLVLGLPAALLGVALNVLPYTLVRWIASRPALSGDVRATWKLFGALFIYPLLWALEAALVGRLAGTAAAVAVLVAALPAGWVALLFVERWRRLAGEARAFLLLRGRPRVRARLRELREEIRRQVRKLAALAP